MGYIEKRFLLPEQMFEALNKEVDTDKQGELFVTLVAQWLENQARAKLRAEVIEGCLYMQDVALEIEQEFNAIDEELHRAIEY